PILIGACAETFGEAASVTAATRAARTASGRLIGSLPRSEIWRREHSARAVGGEAGIDACVAERGALLARACEVLDRLRGALYGGMERADKLAALGALLAVAVLCRHQESPFIPSYQGREPVGTAPVGLGFRACAARATTKSTR